jgi:hypothetical protein
MEMHKSKAPETSIQNYYDPSSVRKSPTAEASMIPHFANVVPQLSFAVFTLFLCIAAAPASAQEIQDIQPLSESLTLDLSLDDKDPDPDCLRSHSAVACTPLRVTVSNHSDKAIGYVTSTCAHPRPFTFEFSNHPQKESAGPQVKPDWQDHLQLTNLDDLGSCSKNEVNWVVVPPHDTLHIPVTLSENIWPLDFAKIETQLPITVRVKWDGGACPAASIEEMKDHSPNAFLHCAANTIYEHTMPVISKPITLHSPTQSAPALPLPSAA